MRGIDMIHTLRLSALIGLGLILSACASGPPATYDLLSPPALGALKPLSHGLIVSEPTAPRVFDTDRVIVRGADGAVSFVEGAQWSDRAPALLQTRIIRAIEKKGYSVAREGTGVVGDIQLSSEIVSFNLVPGSPTQVEVALVMRLIDTREGKLVASRSFQNHVAVNSLSGSDITAGFDASISELTPAIADWVLARRF
jgi:cholesterol transport system auxiliary component